MDILYQPLLQNTNWITITYFLILGLLVVLKYLFDVQFKQQIKIVKQNVWTSNLKLNYALVFNFYNAGFALILSLCFGFIILLLNKDFSSGFLITDFYLYFKISRIILIFFLSKYLLNLLFTTVFKLDDLIHKIMYIKASYLNFLSLFILIWLPFVLFNNTFKEVLLFIGCLTSLLLALYFYYLIIKSNLKFILKHSFYFILYLCALEIAPIIILYKVFISKV